MNKISIEDYFGSGKEMPLIDVRSPAEYQKGHIPGAINIPLFNNDERAEIGILYKNKGQTEAILRGLEIIGPKQAQKAGQAKELATENKLIVHCWRGGMRSESMAWLFSRLGIECMIIEGGYRTYRRFIHKAFARAWKFIILGGMTGSGKTELLSHLSELGAQTIDLEAIANHKGSAFGGIEKGDQPDTEHFENLLYEEFIKMDISREIWLEDESKAIGRVNIPDDIYFNMRSSKVIEVQMDSTQRVKRLAIEYAGLDPDHLKASIKRIEKRLGGQNTKTCLKAIDDKEFEKAIELVLLYYDKAYLKGLSRRDRKSVYPFQIDNSRMKEDAGSLMMFYNEILKNA